jgi:hypothetical protein
MSEVKFVKRNCNLESVNFRGSDRAAERVVSKYSIALKTQWVTGAARVGLARVFVVIPSAIITPCASRLTPFWLLPISLAGSLKQRQQDAIFRKRIASGASNGR